MRKNELHWKLYTLISGIHLKSRRLLKKSLKPLKITFPQFEVLFRLSLGDNITQKVLADRLEKDNTTVMVICDSLEKKGWLNRVKDPTDRRANRVVLTDKGRNVIAKVYPLMTTRYKIITDEASQEMLETILPFLEHLQGIINQHYMKEKSK